MTRGSVIIAGVILAAGAGSHAKCSAFLKEKTHFPKLPTGQQVCPQRPLMAVYVGKVAPASIEKQPVGFGFIQPLQLVAELSQQVFPPRNVGVGFDTERRGAIHHTEHAAAQVRLRDDHLCRVGRRAIDAARSRCQCRLPGMAMNLQHSIILRQYFEKSQRVVT